MKFTHRRFAPHLPFIVVLLNHAPNNVNLRYTCANWDTIMLFCNQVVAKVISEQLKRDNAGHGEVTLNNEATVYTHHTEFLNKLSGGLATI